MNNKIKTLLAGAMALTIALSMAGCGDSDKSSKSSGSKAASSQKEVSDDSKIPTDNSDADNTASEEDTSNGSSAAADDSKTDESTAESDGTSGIVKQRITHNSLKKKYEKIEEYDKNGIVIKETLTENDSIKRRSFEYDDEGNLKFIHHLNASGEITQTEQIITLSNNSTYTVDLDNKNCEFDAKGNLTKFADEKKKDKYTLFDYDSENRVIKEISSNGSYEVFEYDSNGNVTSKTHYDNDGKVNGTQKYNYDASGNLVLSQSYGIKGELSGETTYEYNDKGLLVKETENKIVGENNNIKSTEYEYDQNDNLIKETHYTNGKFKGSYTEHEYDANGNEIRVTNYSQDGPYDEILREFDDYGNTLVIAKYDYINGEKKEGQVLTREYIYW